MNWAVGITTAPRPEPTLHECIASLIVAGWTGCATVAFGPAGLQQLSNFHHLIATLLDTDNEADEADEDGGEDSAFLLLQDDAKLHQNSRRDVQSAMKLHPEPTVFALYEGHPTKNFRGWYGVEDAQDEIGAVAYALNRDTLTQLRDRLEIIKHPSPHVDIAVAHALHLLDIPLLRHSPGLCDHLGENNRAIGYQGQGVPWKGQ